MIDTPSNKPIYIGTRWKDKKENAYKVTDIFFWNNIKMVLFKAIGSLAQELKESRIKNVFVRTADNFLYDYQEIK